MIYANAPISEFMTRVIVTCSPDEPVAAAGARMKEKGVHHLPVIEDGVLVGIVSALDLLHIPADDRPTHPVSEVMTTGVETIDISTTVRDVLTRLAQVAFSAFPVVEDGELVGIVTTADLEELLYRDW